MTTSTTEAAAAAAAAAATARTSKTCSSSIMLTLGRDGNDFACHGEVALPTLPPFCGSRSHPQQQQQQQQQPTASVPSISGIQEESSQRGSMAATTNAAAATATTPLQDSTWRVVAGGVAERGGGVRLKNRGHLQLVSNEDDYDDCEDTSSAATSAAAAAAAVREQEEEEGEESLAAPVAVVVQKWWKRSVVPLFQGSRNADEPTEQEQTNMHANAHASIPELAGRTRAMPLESESPAPYYTSLHDGNSYNMDKNEAEVADTKKPSRLSSTVTAPTCTPHNSSSDRMLGQALLFNNTNTPGHVASSSLYNNNNATNTNRNRNATTTANTITTAEDLLQNDCPFFYREMNSTPSSLDDYYYNSNNYNNHMAPPANRRVHTQRLRALVSSSSSSYHNGTHWNSVSTTTNDLSTPVVFQYKDAVDIISPAVLSRYRTRYQQLNQEIDPPYVQQHQPSQSHNNNTHRYIRRSRDYFYRRNPNNNNNNNNNNIPNDLELAEDQEEGGNEQQQQQQLRNHNNDHNHDTTTAANVADALTLMMHRHAIVQTNTVENSSLYYQHIDGRKFLRLPRDQVRLLMDPDLEAGILSVEQWREPSSALDTCYSHDEDDDNDMNNTTNHNNNNVGDNHQQTNRQARKQQQQQQQQQQPYSQHAPPCLSMSSTPHERPPLYYVLTVQDDLYKRIVSEMSDGLTRPYCGLGTCCHDKEKVDIRVAILILGLTLFFMLISTFIWFID